MKSGYFPSLTEQRIIDEYELGARVANALEDEELGFGPIIDAQFEEWLKREKTYE